MKSPHLLQKEQIHELRSYRKCYEIHLGIRNKANFQFTVTARGGTYLARSSDVISLRSALIVAEAFPPIPLMRVGRGCGKFAPEMFAKDCVDYTDVAPFWFHIDCADIRNAPKSSLHWFTMIDTYVVRIECKMNLLHDVNPVRYDRCSGRTVLQTVIRFPEWLQNEHRTDCPPAVHHQELGDDFDHFQHAIHQVALPEHGHVFDYFSLYNDLDLVYYLKTLITRKYV